MEVNHIYNESCLDTMAKMPDKSVNFVFSDPPYNKNKDYGEYKDNLPEEEYWGLVNRFILEYRRISNNNIGIFIGSELIKDYWQFMPDAKLIIIRKGAIGTPNKAFYRQYFGLLVTATPKMQIYDLWDGIRMPGEGYYFREERYENPGLTSLKLTRTAINYFTNKGDLVYDGFMGVGTTAVACKIDGRRFIGSEISAEYCKIAQKRINAEMQKIDLFRG